jgi:transposase InsO family protein
VLEFTCWNGEIVRVAFALDCHDREVIGWTATTAGISGEMIRDIMVHCVERRFGVLPAAPGLNPPHIRSNGVNST